MRGVQGQGSEVEVSGWGWAWVGLGMGGASVPASGHVGAGGTFSGLWAVEASRWGDEEIYTGKQKPGE